MFYIAQNTPKSGYGDVNQCHGYCAVVRNKWLSQEGLNTQNIFRVDKTVFIRRDGLHSSNSTLIARSNDHGTLQITFKDGSVAHIDNGWFADCGQEKLRDNDNIFGNSNIPSNYILVGYEETR
ncbi:MAG: hypothetical protein LBU65_04345 [Planctomycetaceae bacterium]|nr:hypothetical protein [Planctomycetaceae bacterium]